MASRCPSPVFSGRRMWEKSTTTGEGGSGAQGQGEGSKREEGTEDGTEDRSPKNTIRVAT